VEELSRGSYGIRYHLYYLRCSKCGKSEKAFIKSTTTKQPGIIRRCPKKKCDGVMEYE